MPDGDFFVLVFTQLGLCVTSGMSVTALTAVALSIVFKVLGRIINFVSGSLLFIVVKSFLTTIVLDVVVREPVSVLLDRDTTVGSFHNFALSRVGNLIGSLELAVSEGTSNLVDSFETLKRGLLIVLPADKSVAVMILSVMLLPSDVAVPLQGWTLSLGDLEALIVEVFSFPITCVTAA